MAQKMYKSTSHAVFVSLGPLDALFPNGSVSVRNAQRIGGPSGKPDIITGYANRPDPKVEGKLSVHLSGVPFAGICKLIYMQAHMHACMSYLLLYMKTCVCHCVCI